MIYRDISSYLSSVITRYPVISIIGPRLAGKTNLNKNIIQNQEYVCLADMDERELALNDPKEFLKRFKQGVVIDEVQHAPQLVSYIYSIVNKSHKGGEFILCGSPTQVFMNTLASSPVDHGIVLKLLPLSYQELKQNKLQCDDPCSVIFKGFYPAIYERPTEPTQWYKTYMKNYLDSEVRKFKSVSDLLKFQLFIRCCASRIGQVMNMSSIASECGVNHKTIKAWLSILEASFLIFFLHPHHRAFNKRLVRQPKLYFYDTGLACYLLGIEDQQSLKSHPMYGALFENFVITELIKKKFNQGQEHNLFFWRDNHGHEIDILVNQGEHVIPIEIKSGQKLTSECFKGLNYWKHLSGQNDSVLIYAGNSNQSKDNTSILSWQESLAS
jgi:predicted AAA+ superfamily ATPase